MKDNPLQIKIDSEMEKLVVESIIEDFKNAEEYRNKKSYAVDTNTSVSTTYDNKLTILNDMFYGKRKPKNIPWTNCSNRSLKISMAIIEMLHSRMFPMVWNEDLIRWRPGEKTDKERTERITKFMYWWVNVKTRMHGFFDKWCKVTLAMGDSFTEVSYDVKEIDSGDTEQIPITDEFGNQLVNPDGSLSQTDKKKLTTEETTKTELIPMSDVFFQEGQTDIQEEPVIIRRKYSFAVLEQLEKTGKAVNISEKYSESSSTLREKLSEAIKSATASSNDANAEVMREVKLRNTSVEVIKAYKRIDIDNDGVEEDVRFIIDPVNRIYLGGVYVYNLSKRGKRPIDFTKISDLLYSPNELEGYGYLEMVKPLADEIDAIFNQLTDANTLSVLRPFFYDPGGSLVPQNITLAPNKGIPVPDPSRNVYIPDFQIPTERLLLAIRTVLEFIERLTGASSYVMGKESEIVGGSGTATRTNAIMSSAEQRFTMPGTKLREGAGRILTILLDQLQLNLPPGLETRVLGEGGEPIFGTNELTSDGISGEYDAYILEDAAGGSADAEKQLATFLYSTLMQNPIVATDPYKVYLETANLLRAYKQDPVEHLGPAPEQANMDTPEEENTLIIQGEFEGVRAVMTENHLQHIIKHTQLMQSPTMQMLAPEEVQIVTQFAQQHIQEHMMMMQQMMAVMSKFGGGNEQGGNPATTGTPGNQGLENSTGPLAQMARTKEQGTSQPASAVQQ